MDILRGEISHRNFYDLFFSNLCIVNVKWHITTTLEQTSDVKISSSYFLQTHQLVDFFTITVNVVFAFHNVEDETEW